MADWQEAVKKFEHTPPPQETGSQAPPEAVKQTIKTSVAQSTSKPINSSVNQSVNRPVNQSIGDITPMAKPKGFYITQKQHNDLNKAVEKLAKKMEGKTTMVIDRSIVLRLLIDAAEIDTQKGIDQLIEQLTKQLISQLTNQ